MNYGLNKVIGDNETGFQGTGDGPYRREAWEFILAGGGLFSHLDYSFTVGHEDGTLVLPANQWGGGSPALREQLRRLKDFVQGFDFVRMKPDDKVVRGRIVAARAAGGPKDVRVKALVEPGNQYAIYLGGGTKGVELEIDLPTGDYQAQWLHPRSGRIEPATRFAHACGVRLFGPPVDEEDLALSIRLEAATEPAR